MTYLAVMTHHYHQRCHAFFPTATGLDCLSSSELLSKA
uniref:Nanos-type domain-containing protein n=1 Tax=Parascaris univalens TaxID=6257 RepID=A0A915A1X9_PARUN